MIASKFKAYENYYDTYHNYINMNSSGDEIANVNFLRRQHTCRDLRLRPLNRLANFYYKYLC